MVGMKETGSALRMDGKWKWREAWSVLKAKLLETRQVAAEGVGAVRKQANLYFAAVGQPGLIPLQYIIDRMMPMYIASQLEGVMKDSLKQIKNKNIRKINLESFDGGQRAPQLTASRVYDLKNAMAFDMDVNWDSEMVVKLNLIPRVLGVKVPVQIKNVSFLGTIRVELVPLTNEPPGYGAMLIAFPTIPKINLDIKVAGGEISRVPWLRTEIMNEMIKTIEDEFLWPKRLVIPGNNVLSQRELKELQEHDPLRDAELLLQKEGMLKEYLEKKEPSKQTLKQFLSVAIGGSVDATKNI